MGLMSLYFVGRYTTQLAVFPLGVSIKVTCCVGSHSGCTDKPSGQDVLKLHEATLWPRRPSLTFEVVLQSVAHPDSVSGLDSEVRGLFEQRICSVALEVVV